jgi:putative ABC transport system permease protein
MAIPILSGRNFSVEDTMGSTPAVVVSASLARRFWPDGEAVGQQMGSSPDNQYTVVGVVGDVHNHGLAEGATPMWYRPYSQSPSWPDLTVVARVDGAADARAIGDAARDIDALQPVYDTKPMSTWTAESVSTERLSSWLLALLASLAVLLSGVGLYAVISYTVSQRTQEIGIRMALGADRWRVRRLVIGHGLALTSAGIAIGVALSVWLTRALDSRLYEVSTMDAPTYLAAATLLAAVAFVAELAPAFRATRVDPIIALRHE